MEAQLQGYNAGIADYTLPKSTMAPAPYQTSSSEPGLTGFRDLKPANPVVQARYDAMSPNWEGITATNSYIFQTVPKSQAAPTTQK
jgi:hypothetical protein